MVYDFRAPGVGVFLLTMAVISLGYWIKGPVSTYFDRLNNQATLYTSTEQTIIGASPNLEGMLPIRGYDYDKDGKLDKVERINSAWCYPTEPTNWHEIEESDTLFTKLQEEYNSLLEQKAKSSM